MRFSRLLAILIALTYTVTAIGPRGAALCIGAGHGWSDLIAVRCAQGGGGHHHGPGAGSDGHDHAGCAGCDHHRSGDHGPCTDIPFNPEEGRPDLSQSLVKASGHAGDAGASMPGRARGCARDAMRAIPAAPRFDSWRVRCREVEARRAVILLI
jgi:hypothetical protein